MFNKISAKRLPYLPVALLMGLLTIPSLSFAESTLEVTITALEEWVETERQISETEAEWETERASMQDLLVVYNREIEALDELIVSAEKDTSAAETKRAELLEADEAIKALEKQAVAILAKAEDKIMGLEPLLPPPLREELQPLFLSIPDEPATAKLPIGQRVQPVVAILTQVQKFNQVVTLVEDFREFEAGRTVQTETVFFGLGTAFYVDQANEHAGFGKPGPDGWVWTEDDSLVSRIRSFVDIYRGTEQARYIDVPVRVK